MLIHTQPNIRPVRHVATYRETPRMHMVKTISQGLEGASLKKCSRWAQKVRRMGKPLPGPLSFLFHPWALEMHDQNAMECYGQKAAQMGFTEVMLDRSLFTIDQSKQDVLYILPAKTPDATDFSNARFDPALELSEYLSRIFTCVNNVGLKRAGANSLYVRGSRSRSAMVSIPVGLIVADEMDLFSEEAILLLMERLSGQLQKQFWGISTPSIPNSGINARFELSDQRHFVFKCPHCSRHIELVFPDSLIVCGESESDPALAQSHLICTECRHTLDHQSKTEWLATGQWVTQFPNRSIVGYHISQLYSCVLEPWSIAKLWIGAQTDVVKEQEFFNSKLGLPHIPKGSAITQDVLDACKAAFRLNDPNLFGKGFYTMGVDVGNKLNVEIDQWRLRDDLHTVDINDRAIGKLHYCCEVNDFTDLDMLMYKFKPAMTVIDHLPDTRAALAFARRFPGRVKLCHYGNNHTREIIDFGDRVTVDRTCWLDLALSRFINRTLLLPQDIPIPYMEHIKHLVRIPEKPKDNTLKKEEGVTFRYKKTGDDHYGHSRNYAEIALRLAATSGANTTITERIL